jgi:hypothetical protein
VVVLTHTLTHANVECWAIVGLRNDARTRFSSQQRIGYSMWHVNMEQAWNAQLKPEKRAYQVAYRQLAYRLRP